MAETDLSRLKISRDDPVAGMKRRRRVPWWLAVLGVVALIAAVWIVRDLTAPIAVETVTVSLAYPSQSYTLLNATGYVVAQRKAAVASKATGRLEWLGVREGSHIGIDLMVDKLPTALQGPLRRAGAAVGAGAGGSVGAAFI